MRVLTFHWKHPSKKKRIHAKKSNLWLLIYIKKAMIYCKIAWDTVFEGGFDLVGNHDE